MLFAQLIVVEFDRVNRLFQTKNPDPAKLFEDSDLLVRSMLFKIVLREHASPTADWEGHLLHPRVCALGTVFLDAFYKSPLADSEKDSTLGR